LLRAARVYIWCSINCGLRLTEIAKRPDKDGGCDRRKILEFRAEEAVETIALNRGRYTDTRRYKFGAQ
jgi:hypothetical protein